MRIGNTIWLAADYHFPSSYSCRVPMSSPNSARAMPAPGPATVRLAMIRTGIELFGMYYVRDSLFPVVRAAKVYVKPPDKVAISTQHLRAYKATSGKSLEEGVRVTESLIYREVCHAEGNMTVYLEIPLEYETPCRKTLEAIGYWGQANSFASCISVSQDQPRSGLVARPLRSLLPSRPTRRYFSCIVSEFRNEKVIWGEVMPVLSPHKTDAIRLEVYAWPMVVIEQRSDSKLLLRRSLNE